MFDDDDFKISMDDIKDMVSELFGEKIEKIDASKAKELLKLDTEAFDADAHKLSKEEAELLREYELGTGFEEPAAVPAVQARPSGEVDVDALRKKIEEETRLKLENEMRDRIKQELEDEKQRKKAEVLKKIDSMKQSEHTAAAVPAQAQQAGTSTTHSEKIAIIQMFEQTQKLLFSLLSKLIKLKPVETMFMKTVEKSMVKYPDVLKKIDQNQYGKIRIDGSIEVGRLAANVNAIPAPEPRKTERFFEAMRDVFDERLIAVELAVGIETKDDLLSNLIIQAEKVFQKRGYQQRIIDLFNEHVIPSSTLKPGE